VSVLKVSKNRIRLDCFQPASLFVETAWSFRILKIVTIKTQSVVTAVIRTVKFRQDLTVRLDSQVPAFCIWTLKSLFSTTHRGFSGKMQVVSVLQFCQLTQACKKWIGKNLLNLTFPPPQLIPRNLNLNTRIWLQSFKLQCLTANSYKTYTLSLWYLSTQNM
jgi:hypothetical protein